MVIEFNQRQAFFLHNLSKPLLFYVYIEPSVEGKIICYFSTLFEHESHLRGTIYVKRCHCCKDTCSDEQTQAPFIPQTLTFSHGVSPLGCPRGTFSNVLASTVGSTAHCVGASAVATPATLCRTGPHSQEPSISSQRLDHPV